MFSRVPTLAKNINILDEKDRHLIREVSKTKEQDLKTFKRFFKSGKEIRYDYHQLTYLNEKPPAAITLPMLKYMNKRIYDFRRENIIFCLDCGIYRRPATHHCSKLDYCVEDFDEYSPVFCLPISKENLSHYLALQLWTLANVACLKLPQFFSLFFWTVHSYGLTLNVLRFFVLISLSFIIVFFVCLNLIQNLPIYTDGMYVIDSLMATPELKDRLTS